LSNSLSEHIVYMTCRLNFAFTKILNIVIHLVLKKNK